MQEFDSLGARQLPAEGDQLIIGYDIYNKPIFSGDNIIEFENGDKVQIGDFKEYVSEIPESELIELLGGKQKEVIS